MGYFVRDRKILWFRSAKTTLFDIFVVETVADFEESPIRLEQSVLQSVELVKATVLL